MLMIAIMILSFVAKMLCLLVCLKPRWNHPFAFPDLTDDTILVSQSEDQVVVETGRLSHALAAARSAMGLVTRSLLRPRWQIQVFGRGWWICDNRAWEGKYARTIAKGISGLSIICSCVLRELNFPETHSSELGPWMINDKNFEKSGPSPNDKSYI